MTSGHVSRKLSRRHEFFSTTEAGKVLGVCVRTMQAWVDSGVVPAWRTAGGHRLIPIDAIKQLATERSVRSGQKQGPATNLCDGQPLRLLSISQDFQLHHLARTFASSFHSSSFIPADSAFNALISFGQFDPNLVVFDLALPEVDTIAMVKALSRFKRPGKGHVLLAVACEHMPASSSLPELAEYVTAIVGRSNLASYLSR